MDGNRKDSGDEAPEISAFSYDDERIAHLVRLCARGFSRTLARRLAPYGVTFGQWVFLRILWKQEGLTQRELGEIANLTEPTVHTALTKLAAIGLVERRTKSPNRRKQYTYLTADGRSLREKLEPLAVEANDVALDGIAEKDQRQLRAALLAILENLGRDEAEAEVLGLKVPATRTMPTD